MANEYAVTTNEIMDFLKENMATKDDVHNLQGQIEKIEVRIDKIDGRIDKMDGRIDKIDGRIDKIDGRLMRVESQMVTKEYLDDKLADLKGDILTMFRKEDRRVTALVEIMQRKNLLNDEETRFLGTLRPLVPISE